MTTPAPRPVVARFAPSPTGALHVGGARTALYNWAYARQKGGTFILRIEDTDQKRSSPEATRGILRDLHWLGLTWDEGPQYDPAQPDLDPYENQIGGRGPYFQSQRLDIYKKYADQLLAAGKAYEQDGALRLRMDRDIAFTDEVFGPIKFEAKDLEDFVIMKSDGFPTYHFAVVVDDYLMDVTHVIRGQEHLTNTSKHVALFEAFGWAPPSFAHTPSIMNPDGSKMSKRDKAKAARAAAAACGFAGEGVDPKLFTGFMNKDNDELEVAEAIARALNLSLPEINVLDFQRSGYLPGALLNYLALLGWNPGNDVEKFDLDFMTQNFSLSRVNKGNAKFDRQKLLAFDQTALAALPAEVFQDELRQYTTVASQPAFDAIMNDASKFRAFCDAYQPRAATLADPFTQGAFLVADAQTITPDFDDKGVAKAVLKGDPGSTGVDALRAFLPVMQNCPAENFGGAVHEAIKPFCEEHGYGMGKVAQPIRVAVSGGTVTPPLDVTLDLLGKPETLKRVERFLSLASQAVS